MTVEAMPLVTEKTIAPVSAVPVLGAAAVGVSGPDIDDGLTV